MAKIIMILNTYTNNGADRESITILYDNGTERKFNPNYHTKTMSDFKDMHNAYSTNENILVWFEDEHIETVIRHIENIEKAKVVYVDNDKRIFKMSNRMLTDPATPTKTTTTTETTENTKTSSIFTHKYPTFNVPQEIFNHINTEPTTTKEKLNNAYGIRQANLSSEYGVCVGKELNKVISEYFDNAFNDNFVSVFINGMVTDVHTLDFDIEDIVTDIVDIETVETFFVTIPVDMFFIDGKQTDIYETIKHLKQLIKDHEKLSTSYIWTGGNSAKRKWIEELYTSSRIIWTHNNDTYNVKTNVTCSRARVYVEHDYRKNGKKVTIREIKKALANLEKCVEGEKS